MAVKSSHERANMSEIIAWVNTVFDGHSTSESSLSYEVVVNTPWSCVVKFIVGGECYYLKQVPAGLYIESSIIKMVHDRMERAPVPSIVADNKQMSCYIMKSAGEDTLRSIFTKGIDKDLWLSGIKEYTRIAHSMEEHINNFLDTEIPDWRLYNIPALYKELLEQEGLLKSEGLSDEELSLLRSLDPMVTSLCKDLSSSTQIKQTLINADFNENNMVYAKESGAITIIDLGESVISHPFFTVAAHLANTARRYDLNIEGPKITNLREDWLSLWNNAATNDEIGNDYEVIQKLLPLYFALSTHRLYQVTNFECAPLVSFNLSSCLKLLLNTIAK